MRRASSQKYGYKKRGVCNTLLSIYQEKDFADGIDKPLTLIHP